MGKNRPWYETDPNKVEEKKFSNVVATTFRCNFRKLPVQYGLDFSMYGNRELVGFAEMKCRTNPVRAYPTYMVSTKKYDAASKLNAQFGLPCYLFVRWTDRWGCTEIHTMRDGVEVGAGGRTDRGDPQDVEQVAYIPLSHFLFY